MAYNDMDNNNTKNPLYDKPTTNGPVFENAESSVDPSRIRLSYWNNMIKVTIEPKLNNGSQIPEYDKNNSISAFLTPSRAITLTEALKELKANDNVKYVGVLCKESMLRVSKGYEFGKPGLYMVIEKVAGRDDLNPISTYIYEFGGALNEFVMDIDGEQKFSAINTVDFTIFENTLAEFIKASTGAIAGSVLTVNSYNTNLVKERLNAIATNLGIEVPVARKGNNGVPGRTPAGGIKPNNQSSFSGMNPPTSEKAYSGNVEDDLLG